MRIKHIVTAVAASTVVLFSSVGMAGAAPGDSGKGTGGCIDNFYGNATNPRPSGNGVLPSQSPGPFVNNPIDPTNPTRGASVGDVMKYLATFGITGADAQAIICTFP